MGKIFLIFTVFLFITCSNEQSGQIENKVKQYIPGDAVAFEDGIEIEPPRTAEPSPPPEFDLEKGSKIIKIGGMTFEVPDLNRSKRKIDSLISEYKSYYENEQYNSYGDRISYSLLIRIPSERFDSLVNEFENGVGRLLTKNLNSRDVTEEYIDLKIRLDNNLLYLSQYREILKRAGSIKDILEVQEKIRRIEEEIESKKGRIQFFDDKVNYSTLNLEISELISPGLLIQPSFVRKMTNAFQNGIDGFLGFILVLVNLWPFLILGFLLVTFRKRLINLVRGK